MPAGRGVAERPIVTLSSTMRPVGAKATGRRCRMIFRDPSAAHDAVLSAGIRRVPGKPRVCAAMVRLLVLIGLALISFGDTSVAAPRRVALVVGAGEYGHAPALAHTLNDAREVAAALTRLEFDVDLILNPDRTALENAVRRLGQRSRGADASLFYFSGHALEAQRVNWLLPVSADVKADDDLRFRSPRSSGGARADREQGARVAALSRRLP